MDPAEPALVEGGWTVTYGELSERVTGRAEVGARTVLDTPDQGIDWVVALLARLESGGQAVLADPAWKAADRRTALDALGPADDAAGIWLFTSGTTARPKPRFRSIEATAAMLDKLRARLPPAVADGRPSSLCIVPLHHGFGLLNALLLILRLGGSVHFASPNSPEAAWRNIVDQEIRVLYAWPSDFRALGDHRVGRRARTALEWCVSSSRRLAAEVAVRFAEGTGCPLRQQYGTTETGPLTVDSAEPPDPRSVGTALDGVEILVVDDNGHEQPTREQGRIAVRVAPWFSPQLRRASDGLYYPGDLGWKDARGRFFITARDRPFTDERADDT